MYICTFGNQKRELRFGHKYGSEQYMLPQWSHTYHNVVDLPSYHYCMCWEIQECHMSISNPLIYVICYNIHLQYFLYCSWFYSSLLFNSILYFAVESQVHTLGIIVFVKNKNCRHKRETRYLHHIPFESIY